MSGSFADRLLFRRAPLAIALCLLAFLFAIEAKTAMFGPENGPGSDIRAAKAQPAAAPELLKHRILLPDSLHPHADIAALPPATTVAPQVAHFSLPKRVLRNQFALFTAAFLSPQHFFRPPPAF